MAKADIIDTMHQGFLSGAFSNSLVHSIFICYTSICKSKQGRSERLLALAPTSFYEKLLKHREICAIISNGFWSYGQDRGLVICEVLAHLGVRFPQSLGSALEGALHFCIPKTTR